MYSVNAASSRFSISGASEIEGTEPTDAPKAVAVAVLGVFPRSRQRFVNKLIAFNQKAGAFGYVLNVGSKPFA